MTPSFIDLHSTLYHERFDPFLIILHSKYFQQLRMFILTRNVKNPVIV